MRTLSYRLISDFRRIESSQICLPSTSAWIQSAMSAEVGPTVDNLSYIIIWGMRAGL